jgi:hypothetical protein
MANSTDRRREALDRLLMPPPPLPGSRASAPPAVRRSIVGQPPPVWRGPSPQAAGASPSWDMMAMPAASGRDASTGTMPMVQQVKPKGDPVPIVLGKRKASPVVGMEEQQRIKRQALSSPPPSLSRSTTTTMATFEVGEAILKAQQKWLRHHQEARKAKCLLDPPSPVLRAMKAANAKERRFVSRPEPAIAAATKRIKSGSYDFSYSGSNGGFLPAPSPAATACCSADPDGSLRAPEPETMSEEHANVLWELSLFA